MNKKIVNMITGCFIASIFILSGCTSNDSNQDIKSDNSYPLFPNAKQTTYENDTIWNIMNVSSELNKTFYVTDSEISDIIDWYETRENIEEYEILDGGSSGISITNIDVNNVSYGYAKVHKNNKTKGLFVFVIKSLEEMQLEKENLMGIAIGPWDLIDVCEKTGNFTSLK